MSSRYSASLPAAAIRCKSDLFGHIVSKHTLTNLVFLTEAQHSDKGAPKITANPHLAFDMEEHFEKVAEV